MTPSKIILLEVPPTPDVEAQIQACLQEFKLNPKDFLIVLSEVVRVLTRVDMLTVISITTMLSSHFGCNAMCFLEVQSIKRK
jgi:hypothetical protein